MTKAEIRLWIRLKALRGRGFHFRRQAPFLGYFLDFVCFNRRLVIELDGGHHGQEQQAEHDWIRDRVLTRAGFLILRFWNAELDGDIEGVVDRIVEALSSRCPIRPIAIGVGTPSP